MKRTAVLNVVGLTESLLGPSTPRINRFLAQGAKTTIVPAFPAVTCTAQSTYLTGTTPAQHGIVGNGWYNRELAEVQFWKQSNHLVHGRKIWEELRSLVPNFTCAKLFWWYNMYSSADYSITPRPMYPADGRKVFDIYTWPYSIRTEIKQALGEFPFPTFWGPAAGVKTPQGERDAATRWIAESAKWIEDKFSPTLSLIYLPHLDYNLQRLGPKHPEIARDLEEIDAIVGGLIDFFSERSVQVILLSEYGITPVDTPIPINRILRENGWLTVKEELGLELLNCGASKAFAVADHQIAHIYLNDPGIAHDVSYALRELVRVLDRKQQAELGIDHPRAGDLIAIAPENAWFTYYYWLDDNLAPDFARCVDIHRKPGYDPAELFLDPKIPMVKLKILRKLLQKKLGFRMLMDVIPLDATLVKGSHGCRPSDARGYPLIISSRPDLLPSTQKEATDVYHILKRHVLY
ncbi:MAG TPA: nucleotide pyrophosphatase/phosphodiesterase family protein [Verrucomicrobiae bacterium]|nr:nucleotide pyrophosphatase/phosphodiesterase family protein [Verrucomicrobiae bacterium]